VCELACLSEKIAVEIEAPQEIRRWAWFTGSPAKRPVERRSNGATQLTSKAVIGNGSLVLGEVLDARRWGLAVAGLCGDVV